jgi:AraC-like DNA-binding protein
VHADGLVVTTHDGADGWWQMVRRAPDAAVRGPALRYTGYEERTVEPVRRREVPTGAVGVILSFGDTIDVLSMSSSPQPRGGTFRSFVAGFHEGYAVTEHAGRQHGVEMHLSPLGASRLLGAPMSELANQVVELGEVRGRAVDELTDRLAGAPGWPERFALVDATLARWLGDAPEPDRAVAWAWQQLRRSHGTASIAALAVEIGWSRRHFAARFREQVGLPPKAAARILRFRHAVTLLDRAATIADVAATAGYADHSHLVREFRALAGCTPSELARSERVDDGGLAA